MRWIARVRFLSLSFALCLLVLVFAPPAIPQIPLGRCGPRPTDPADWPRNPPLDQPAPPHDVPKQAVPRNTVQLKHDAQELAELSVSVTADIDQVNHGLLPKDVVEKLKRIEKLSKRLRNELAQ
jgi:hypothetical protein